LILARRQRRAPSGRPLRRRGSPPCRRRARCPSRWRPPAANPSGGPCSRRRRRARRRRSIVPTPGAPIAPSPWPPALDDSSGRVRTVMRVDLAIANVSVARLCACRHEICPAAAASALPERIRNWCNASRSTPRRCRDGPVRTRRAEKTTRCRLGMRHTWTVSTPTRRRGRRLPIPIR
jgi:hypothetical protein